MFKPENEQTEVFEHLHNLIDILRMNLEVIDYDEMRRILAELTRIVGDIK